MIDPENLICQINKDCKKTISNDFKLNLKESQHNLRRYIIEGKSQAVNRFDYPQETVKVLKWFNDFWLYLEIKFIAEKNKIKNKISPQINIGISLSLFQGDDSNIEKYQLFRAEWDDFNNIDEKHAQPHWHITSNQALEKTILNYSGTFEKQDFISLLESEKRKVFDVKNIHFAMNGNWQNKTNHIHKIESEKQLVNWLLGLLNHIRTELEL